MAQNKFQHTFTKSKMNKDLDSRLLARDEYRDGQNIAVSRSESDDVGALENILGNQILSSLNIPNITSSLNKGFSATTYKEFVSQIIGAYFNQDTNRVYLFLTNYQDNSSNNISNFAPVGTRCSIVLFDTNSSTTTTIVEGRFLNFSLNSPILDVVMIENLMYFTDDRNQPRMINVNTAEDNVNYYSSEDHISLAKYYPYRPMQLNKTYNALEAGLISSTNFPFATGGIQTKASIYPWLAIPTSKTVNTVTTELNTELIAMLKNNIGLKGYISSEGTQGNPHPTFNFEFTVAQVFQTEEDSGIYNDICIVYLDRDLGATASDSGFNDVSISFWNQNNTTYNLDKVVFVEPNAKDVVSPWDITPKTRLTISSVDAANGRWGYGTTYCNHIYKYGMSFRKNQQTTAEVFNVPGWNPNQVINLIPSQSNPGGYARVTHPKLDPLKYYVITEVAGAPSTSSQKYFKLALIENLVSGGQPTLISTGDVPLAAGDVVDIRWPNKDYDPNFIGDEELLKDKFVRFAYRFKYDDGEYSLISPFTQEVFIPKLKGQFLKKIGKQKSTGSNVNNFIPGEQRAGESTIVNFMENEITQVSLDINCEYKFSELNEKLKVVEIDIIYKDSMNSSMNVIESIEVTDNSINNNNSKTLRYVYKSKKPIKTLRSSETTRVYDNVPVRAKTITSTGNRVLMANYYDRHSAPNTLTYYIGSGDKQTPATTATALENLDLGFDVYDKLPNKYSYVAYPNHSLKQNRTYQVGLVLQDRYGRSSDVILSSVNDEKVIVNNNGVNAWGNYGPPMEFSGSTIFHPYKGSVVQPLSPASTLLRQEKAQAGILSWPGDSLKALFLNTIPKELPFTLGYPGIYKSPFLTIQVSSQSFDYIYIPSTNVSDNIVPGMLVEWTIGDIEYSAYVGYVLNSGSNIVYLKNQDGSSGDYPPSGTQITFYEVDKPTGWYSYKMVVKQQEQEYYNVYLPSLLDGLPVIKPFTIGDATAGTGGATFTSGSNQVVMTPVTGIEYLTFPLLEGMKVITAGGNSYFIQNVLNYTTFELTVNATATETDVSFDCSMGSSDGVLNCTTLLTDNANKVSPALNEASPVQVNFSTSNVELIPRFAQSTTWSASSLSPFFTTDRQALPVFPGRQKLNVRAIGNFENLFKNASFNGLYEADTNPPSAVIENTFEIGSDSDTSLPTSEQEPIAAVYETTPTFSNLEIYYETSTAGLISDLNTLVNNTVDYPAYFFDRGTNNVATNQIIRQVNINENLNFSTAGTIRLLNIHGINGDLYRYYSTVPAFISIDSVSVTKAYYRNLIAVAGDGISFTKYSSTDGQNKFKVEVSSNFPAYHSSNEDLNYITLEVEVIAKMDFAAPTLKGTLAKYTLPLTIYIENSPPLANGAFVPAAGSSATTVYYLKNINSVDPQAYQSNGSTMVEWDNENGGNTTLTSCTNGGNVSNTFQECNTEELSFNLLVKFGTMTEFKPANSINGLGLYLSTAGLDQGSVVLATTSKSQLTQRDIECQITATDKLGKGETTLLSEFIVNILS